MSLILEALRKLDRDKLTPERGFLVMAPAPWPSSSRIRAPHVVFGVAVAMSLGAGLAYWSLRPAAPIAPTPGSTTLPAAAKAPGLVTAPSVPVPVPDPRPRLSQPALPPLAAAHPSAIALPQAPDAAPVAPSAPAALVERFAAPFALQAISSRDGSPVAIINGRMVREGDVIDGVTVLKIGVETVELDAGGVHHVLRF